MRRDNKFDVIINLNHEEFQRIDSIIEKEKSVRGETIATLLESYERVAHLNYEVTRSVIDLDSEELESELESRGMVLEAFQDKVYKNLTKSVKSIVSAALFKSYGISMLEVANSDGMLTIEKGLTSDALPYVEMTGRLGVEVGSTLYAKLKVCDTIDMKIGNITSEQNEILKDSHDKFMRTYVNPHISGSNRLDEEDVVKLMSLMK